MIFRLAGLPPGFGIALGIGIGLAASPLLAPILMPGAAMLYQSITGESLTEAVLKGKSPTEILRTLQEGLSKGGKS